MTLKDEVAALEGNLNRLQADVARLTRENDDLRKQKAPDAQLRRENAQLQDVKTENVRLVADLLVARQDRDRQHEEIAAVRKEANRLRKELSKAVLTPDEGELHIRRLTAVAEQVKREVADATERNQVLSRQLEVASRAHDADHAKMIKQIGDLRAVNARLGTTQEALRAELGDVRAQRDKYRKAFTANSGSADAETIKELRNKVSSLVAAKDLAEGRASSADNRAITMRITTTAAQRRVIELEESLKSSTRALNGSRNAVQEMKHQIAQLIGELESARRILKEKEIQIEGLHIKLEVASARAGEGK